jgi:branched-chain amino acid transport system permease protein
MGLDVDRMISLTLVISSALGGLAGIMFGVALGDISPYIGRDTVEVRGLAIIVLGGMGSVGGAVLGGYVLALIELVALLTLGSSASGGVAFAALFLMLILRPQGFFGTRLRERI